MLYYEINKKLGLLLCCRLTLTVVALIVKYFIFNDILLTQWHIPNNIYYFIVALDDVSGFGINSYLGLI